MEHRKKKMNRRTKQLIFYICIVAIPLIQFCIFYIGVNMNSILLAFKSFDSKTNGFYFDGFTNFRKIYIDWTTTSTLKNALKNSIILYFVSLSCMFVSLVLSYYIYKRRSLSGLFKVILFIPNIVSGLILALIYMYFTERAVPEFFSTFGKTISGLLSNSKTSYYAVLGFNVFLSFGTQTIFFTGSMEGISDSITDSAKMDGCTPVQEFFRITLPMIWPTIITFLTVGIAGMFLNQMGLYSFYGAYAENRIITLGYYLYKETLNAGVERYPYLASLGLILTIIVIPITYLVRGLAKKFGPKVT